MRIIINGEKTITAGSCGATQPHMRSAPYPIFVPTTFLKIFFGASRIKSVAFGYQMSFEDLSFGTDFWDECPSQLPGFLHNGIDSMGCILKENSSRKHVGLGGGG